MKPEKIMELADSIARNADPELYERFRKDWRMFDTSLMADCNPVFKDCAALIKEALLEMDKTANKSSKTTAAKHIATNSSRESLRGVWINDQGRSCLCDGYRAIRTIDTFASIPAVEPWQELPRVFKEPETYTRELPLPSIAELKKTIADQKAKEGRNARPVYDFGDELPLVNAAYLLDMLSLLPGAIAYISSSRPQVCPIYFKADNGDGILLPVNPNFKKR